MRPARSVLVVAALLIVTACSNVASGPRVYESGVLSWGSGPEQHVEWRLEEALGFQDAVTLIGVTPTGTRTSRAGRAEPGDLLWWSATVLAADAPTVAFGGAGGGIDSVVVSVAGEEIEVDLLDVEGRDWRIGLVELPRGWARDGLRHPEVVGHVDGVEVARTGFQTISG